MSATVLSAFYDMDMLYKVNLDVVSTVLAGSSILTPRNKL